MEFIFQILIALIVSILFLNEIEFYKLRLGIYNPLLRLYSPL
jgi:hypothetical protein